MSAWRKWKTQPEQGCPLDEAEPHPPVEAKRVIPDVIATGEEGPQSTPGSNPGALNKSAAAQVSLPGAFPPRIMLGLGGGALDKCERKAQIEARLLNQPEKVTMKTKKQF